MQNFLHGVGKGFQIDENIFFDFFVHFRNFRFGIFLNKKPGGFRIDQSEMKVEDPKK